jgi:hypothetical protein
MDICSFDPIGKDGEGEGKSEDLVRKKKNDRRIKQVMGLRAMAYKVHTHEDEEAHSVGSSRSSRACQTVFPAPLVFVLLTILSTIGISFIVLLVLLQNSTNAAKDIR